MGGSGCRYCSLWKAYRGERYYDDAHAPWRAPGAPRNAQDEPQAGPWTNILPTAPSAEAWAAATTPDPARRCAGLGLATRAVALVPPPPDMGRGRPGRRVHWLHIPKTGSSFGTTLYHWGCPRIPHDAYADDGAPIVRLTQKYPRARRKWCDRDAFSGNLNGHEPLRYPQQRGRTLALFRAPDRRLASECAALDTEFRRAFGASEAAPPGVSPGVQQRTMRHMHSRRTEHRNGSIYANTFLREFLQSHGLSHAAIEALRIAWNAHRAIPVSVCAAQAGMRGCQTKMVLGVPCSAPYTLNASLFAEAARRVRRHFLFVGLTERFDESICLFHVRFGGQPVGTQFLNTRPRGIGVIGGSGGGGGGPSRRPWPRAGDSLPPDAWDEALYRVAVERFEADLFQAVKEKEG